MHLPSPALLLLLAALLLLLALPARASARADARWRWPVRGEVLTPFAVGGSPFAGGRHRGIDIAAPPGARVRAACTGTVTFAGRVPGRGRAVSVACGPLVATHLELGSVRVARGRPVAAGTAIGTVAASHVQLGARRIGRRFGYVDPLTLLRAGRRPPLGVAPPPRGRPPTARVGVVPAPLPALSPQPSPAMGARGSGMVVWAGLALLASGIGLGGVWHWRAARALVLTRRVTAERDG